MKEVKGFEIMDDCTDTYSKASKNAYKKRKKEAEVMRRKERKEAHNLKQGGLWLL